MLLLTDDPLTLSQSKIEQFELKLTFDVQFLLEVEINFNSPKIQIAMQNLSLKEQDLQQKKISQFFIMDEDYSVTEQRYLLHLHQIAQRRKLLVKERNKIKKEEAETLKYDQLVNTRYYSQTESFNYLNIENAISMLDKRIELQQIKKDKTQLILKNKIREQIEEELKILNENKVLEQENLRVKKLKKQSLKAISDRAHSFNQKTQQIAKKHQESIQYEQEKAFERQKEILSKDKLESDDSERGLYQNQIKQKEKELKDLLKQKQVNDRIKQIKQQEIEQCNQLYAKIQSKLNKSQINRLSLLDNNRTSVFQNTQSHQKVEESQKFLEKYIQKQTRYINNSKESQRQLTKLKKRKNIKQQFNQDKQTNYTKIEETYPEKKSSNYSPQLNKKNKSRSLVNLEKINLQQLEKVNKVLEKQRSSSILQSQIRERKEILREASKSNFQQRSQFQELQHDLSKIKNNVSKEFLFKKISKWDCVDLINKYYK
ncbi:unnamed protein product (macronuclear) [Paramecium tetraurelia]|uniref:DUF4201 domain-containing protein n=1 Tax=Paramecium tetraurelia TaxID=5888 RepID=A0BMT7_PARTE|nr:uncharacterized protein GSPATT00030490001 [Paramecium tetraurelia]CAK59854.1 unnamed protein product [Paramecium tetraurelia]|eukprot:XP_001427252.1 hypothetical protein (macronuclear) [Paramecium tetraurelia strain d4-2]